MTNAAWLAELSLPLLQRELMFTASALCFSQIQVLRGPSDTHCTYRCRECGQPAASLNQLRHCPACKVGEVHAVLLALASTVSSPASPEVQAVQSTPERSLRAESSSEPVVTAAALAGDQARPFLLPETSGHVEEVRRAPQPISDEQMWGAAPVAATEGVPQPPFAVAPTGEVIDREGVTIVDPQGCDLAEPDDLRMMHRIAACLNYCKGVPTPLLVRSARELAVRQ
ncbi:MAG: hypothetical protein JWM54_2155 [Acidobacteriaceae bacterium]|jgi:hypothetical protein|nr:hypothetical protein [Acidobacteriaceae bacterium]